MLCWIHSLKWFVQQIYSKLREEFFIHLSHTFAFFGRTLHIKNDTIFASQSQYQIK